jgi:hypothetical protein
MKNLPMTSLDIRQEIGRKRGTFVDPFRVDSGVVDQEGSMTNGDLRSIILPLVVTISVGALAVLIAVVLGIALD